MENLRQLLAAKKETVTTNKDKEKISIIENLFTDDAIFFHMDIDTAYGILAFLGIPKEKIPEVYSSLTSPEAYMQTSRPYFMGPIQK